MASSRSTSALSMIPPNEALPRSSARASWRRGSRTGDGPYAVMQNDEGAAVDLADPTPAPRRPLKVRLESRSASTRYARGQGRDGPRPLLRGRAAPTDRDRQLPERARPPRRDARATSASSRTGRSLRHFAEQAKLNRDIKQEKQAFEGDRRQGEAGHAVQGPPRRLRDAPRRGDRGWPDLARAPQPRDRARSGQAGGGRARHRRRALLPARPPPGRPRPAPAVLVPRAAATTPSSAAG